MTEAKAFPVSGGKAFSPLSEHEESLGKIIIDAAVCVHKQLGPGLLEKVYEVCFCHELTKRGCQVQRQIAIPVIYDGITFDEGLRIDVLVNDQVIIELKAVDTINPVWQAQVLSYLRLTGKRLGYVINFNVPVIKQGIQRIIL
jgi:GxxExxY protein